MIGRPEKRTALEVWARPDETASNEDAHLPGNPLASLVKVPARRLIGFPSEPGQKM